MTPADLRIGSQVLVASGFGAGMLQRGIVVGVYDDIKDGNPGIDYSSESDRWHSGRKADHWAYLSQVREIEKY